MDLLQLLQHLALPVASQLFFGEVTPVESPKKGVFAVSHRSYVLFEAFLDLRVEKAFQTRVFSLVLRLQYVVDPLNLDALRVNLLRVQ